MRTALTKMLRPDDLCSGDSTEGSVMRRQRAILARQCRQSPKFFTIDSKKVDFRSMPQFPSWVNGDSDYVEMSYQHSSDTLKEFVGGGVTVDVVPLELASTSNSVQMDRSSSLHSACTEAMELAPAEGEIGGRNLKKRKAEHVVADRCKDKEHGGAATSRQGKSAVSAKSNVQTSTDNSKVSDIQKASYIHVRARRGQATDSHSLAERARREKINKKMKFLQDLVPGCNKVTGKLGMLEEIINYVQSLQSQVEFLSTKLAALNPLLDFNADYFMKEFPAHVTGFPAVGLPSELENLAYFHFNQAQGAIDIPVNPAHLASQRTPNSSMSIPTVYLDSSTFPAQQLSPWDTDPHTLHNTDFH